MKTIFAAIGAALRAAFSMFWTLCCMPGRLLAGLLGGSVPAPVGDSPLVEQLQEEIDLDAIRKNAERAASIVSGWCIDSMTAGRPLPAPIPPRVSRGVAQWLPGLTREECAELVCAGKEAICEHLAGTCAILGVRPVQRLQALSAWEPATAWVEPSPGVLTIELAARSEPDQAAELVALELRSLAHCVARSRRGLGQVEGALGPFPSSSGPSGGRCRRRRPRPVGRRPSRRRAWHRRRRRR